MRFLEDGPDLPDDLLVARDDGRVLFFCGAGVSRAYAKLPGFLGLAERVLQELRALPDSSARKLVDLAGKLESERIAGVGGILAADRIFGLLERDFSLLDIERAVGRALAPSQNVNLGAHRILLGLSRSPNGNAQLVTTNFDLLFERASPNARVWTPATLPDLSRQAGFQGIVHLHGKLDPSYSKAVGGNLVLSSAEFGRAYLAEGWATDFIRSAIDQYLIVFVGYAADDPPVQYLLEALNRASEHSGHRLFAFQDGQSSDAAALWKHKGVTAIPYGGGANHEALWSTLSAWVKRARGPDRWRQVLLSKARRGPESLRRFERGQIFHLASTADGARALAESKKPIAATWICAFDRTVRYGTPGPASFRVPLSPEADPFLHYSVDSDPEPEKTDPADRYKPRQIPRSAIDALHPVPLDGANDAWAAICGDEHGNIAQLPRRLISLISWFTHVCGEPQAIWWAAGQHQLHPILRQWVGYELDRQIGSFTPAARQAWRYLFERCDSARSTNVDESYAVNQRIAKEGWTASTRRAVQEALRPILRAERPYGSVPPSGKRLLQIRDAISLSVEYSKEEIPIEIPDAQIAFMLPLLRTNLLEAADLEFEIRPSGSLQIPPIEPDPNLPGESSDRSWGLNRHVLKFAALFRRLVDQDASAAFREFSTWPSDDHSIFARLRIWAAGISGLMDAAMAGSILTTVSDRVFWGDRDQRDLLLVLGRRWNKLDTHDRHKLEARLRKGLPRRRQYDPKLYPKWRARSIVERLKWLAARGCTFDFDLDAVIATECALVPEWNESYAEHAADSHEGRGGSVHVDHSFDEVANASVDKLVEVALGKREHRHWSLQMRDPYEGLVQQRPVRILAALRRFSTPSEIAVLGWTGFLRSGARRNDNVRLAALIMCRVLKLPPAMFVNVRSAVGYWLDDVAQRVFEFDANLVRSLFDRVSDEVAAHPEDTRSADRLMDDRRDWLDLSLNSVVGRLAEVLFGDPLYKGLQPGSSLPRSWKDRGVKLLSLPGDNGRFALAQFGRRLGWLYALDPIWTEERIVTGIFADTTDRDVVLAGFFNNAQCDASLFTRLKPLLTQLASGNNRLRRHHENVLASLFITGWRTTDANEQRLISDDELRGIVVHGTVEMRTHMLSMIPSWPIAERLVLLRNVWPLQLVVRGTEVNSRLCWIAFNDDEHFSEIADSVMPLLAKHQGGLNLAVSSHDQKQKTIFAQHAGKVLELLTEILPETAANWPHGTDVVLDRLLKSAPNVARDERFRELRRRLTHRHA